MRTDWVRHRLYCFTHLYAFVPLFIFFLFFSFLPQALAQSATAPPSLEEAARQKASEAAKKARQQVKTVEDHESLLGMSFKNSREVTQACLECHDGVSAEVHKSIHWSWINPEDPEGKLGKNGKTLNNFGISIHSNEARCIRCHVSNNPDKTAFTSTEDDRVDCLVCHDSTGKYKKFAEQAENSSIPPQAHKDLSSEEYATIAAAVTLPRRENCGTCHFAGNPQDIFRHGNLEAILGSPSRTMDVHMASEGANFSCYSCHSAGEHELHGIHKVRATHEKTAAKESLPQFIRCESCHTSTPHKLGHKANYHSRIMACQTCHVPSFARTVPMQSSWDWSKAGTVSKSAPIKPLPQKGQLVAETAFGEIRWEQNSTPSYVWYNGQIEYLTAQDRIDPTKPVALNKLRGSKDDPGSRIMPVRVHRAMQPYDTENKTMVIPKLFGDDPEAFENSHDWNRAIKAGMKEAGLPYSGHYAFVATEYVYPLTHMIAPKEETLHCDACHIPNGQLGDLEGFYLPGRDRSANFDHLGLTMLLIALGGVSIHLLIRLVLRMRRNTTEHAKPTMERGASQNVAVKRIFIYKPFERFWHWTQSLLIFLLLLSGFEVHGVYHLVGFEKAFYIHNISAWAWLALYLIVLGWMAYSGTWRQYVPTLKMLIPVIRFYSYGIFKGEHHPVKKTPGSRLNALQRFTYLGLAFVLIPFQMVSGFVYYYYEFWPEYTFFGWDMHTIAMVHTFGAFAFMMFVVIHVYMTTTGHTFFAYMKCMVTGYEEVPADEEDESPAQNLPATKEKKVQASKKKSTTATRKKAESTDKKTEKTTAKKKSTQGKKKQASKKGQKKKRSK